MANLRKVSKKELLETFDKFLLAVDFRIEHLKYATKDNSYNWDFSLKSLDSLENFILKKNIDENHELFDDVASYIGEVVRRNYGGKWECCLDMRGNSMLYGMPLFLDLTNTEFCLVRMKNLDFLYFVKKRE